MVARGIQADEIADRLDVLLEAVEVAGLLAGHGAAEAGADRVDEDQVGHVEKGEFVVHQMIGRRE